MVWFAKVFVEEVPTSTRPTSLPDLSNALLAEGANPHSYSPKFSGLNFGVIITESWIKYVIGYSKSTHRCDWSGAHKLLVIYVIFVLYLVLY